MCSKSLYGTFLNMLNYNAYIEGNSYRLKLCLSRKDANEKCDKTFRLEWSNITWDIIAAIKLWKKPCNTGRITLLTVELWSERMCQWLSKISAGHKHQPKEFRIMTSRLIRGLVNPLGKKDSVTNNETFSDNTGTE